MGLDSQLPVGRLEVCALQGAAAPLLSRQAHKDLGLIIDYEEDVVMSKALNRQLDKENADSGHQLLRLDNFPTRAEYEATLDREMAPMNFSAKTVEEDAEEELLE